MVSQFMSQVIFTLDNELPLADAAQFLASHKLTTVPVVKKSGEIVGVLTDFQLLRFLLRAKNETKHIPLAEFEDELDPVMTIPENESIVNAFRLMIQSPNHRIYTLKDGKLIGALSPKDLLLYMAGVKEKGQHAVNSVVQQQIENILRELQDTRRMLNDYQKMFMDSPFLMHSVDMSGKIVAANRMLHFVLGYNDGELVGKSLRQLYPPENYRKAVQGLETVKALGFHPIVNVTMVKRDGDLVRVDVASTLKKDENGGAEATITVGRLSDSHRMLNYLQRAAQMQNRVQKKSG
jgi:PAS domain S-box-containing protein